MRIAALLALLIAAAWTPSALAQEPDDPEPRGAEDHGAEDDPLHIPEPLVFDLVRGLGASAGELEVNVLGQYPLSSASGAPIDWAPEVEAAVLNGFALELELPFEGGRLAALKVAAQVTFGMPAANFIHGAQAIVERETDRDAWELTAVYIPGIRLDRTWSLLLMVGARAHLGADSSRADEAILNASVFADVGPRTSLGVEADGELPFEGGGGTVLLMPQLHQELTDHAMVQLGVGARIRDGGAAAEAAARLIYSF